MISAFLDVASPGNATASIDRQMLDLFACKVEVGAFDPKYVVGVFAHNLSLFVGETRKRGHRSSSPSMMLGWT